MAMKIRLARGGSKKRPFYRVVAADSAVCHVTAVTLKNWVHTTHLLAKDDENTCSIEHGTRSTTGWAKAHNHLNRVARFLEASGDIGKNRA